MEIEVIEKTIKQKSIRGKKLCEMLRELEAINHISCNGTSFTIGSILSHKNVYITDLVRYSDSDNWYYRARIAGNHKTPKHILIKLSNNTHPCVLKSLAINPKTPKTVLDKLSKLRSEYDFNYGEHFKSLQLEIAKNHNTSEDTLHFLSKMRDSDIVSNVLFNPSTSIETIKYIGTLNFRGVKKYSKLMLKRKLNQK